MAKEAKREKEEVVEEITKEFSVEDLPGVGPKGAKKLKDAGYNDLMAIAAASIKELMLACEVGEGTAEKIIVAARDKLDIGYKTADVVLERRKEINRLTTGSKNLDALVGGGIETQYITEAFGAFASGKTQLGFQLAVNVQLPKEKGGLNGRCLFIDTENSLPYDERILIKSENGIELIEIGKLVEEQIKEDRGNDKITVYGNTISTSSNKRDLKAVSFDPEDYKIKTFPITGFIKHGPKKIYRVKLASGRSVRVTEYHNFFSLNKHGDLEPVATKSLGVGDKICVAGNLPVENYIEGIDLSEILSEKDLFVRGDDEFGEKLIEIKGDLKTIAKNRNKNADSAYNWIKRKEVPLDVFTKIKTKIDKDVIRDLKIGGWSRKNNISLVVKVDKDILWLLGLYVAEGSCVRKDYGRYYINRVIISNTKNNIERKVKTIGGKIGLRFSRNKGDLKVESRAFALLIKKLNMGNYAKEKKIPEFILKLDKEKINAFLQGYIEGDGSIDTITGTTNCETVSPYLAEGLLYSTLSLEIPSRNSTVTREYNNKPSKTFNVHWQTDPSRSSRLEELPNSNLEIGGLLKSVRKKLGLSQNALAKTCGLNTSIIHQIESGAAKNVRRSTLKKIIQNLRDNEIKKLKKLVESEIWFDAVAEIEECGIGEVYDIEVMPDGNEVQNFIGGYGGIILHNTFRPERVEQIATSMGLDPKKVLKNIYVARAYNSDHQILLLDKAKEMIRDKNIKLIIIDSITSHFRSDYSGRGELAPRQQKLNRHLHGLQKMSEVYNVAVYMTNQVMSRPDVMFGDPTTAIGGHILAHASGIRLYLRKSKGSLRIVKLIDAPNLPEGEAVFTVTENGIGDGER